MKSSLSPAQSLEPAISFRWLGAAGVELRSAGQGLLIDPCLRRIRFRQLWFGKLDSDQALARRHIPQADHILISHAHYDHLLDAPGLALSTGAQLYGSPNACRLSQLAGVPAEQVHTLQGGETLHLGEFTVRVLPARHRWVPFFTPGALPARLSAPFTARQYRLDLDFSFLVQAAGMRLLIDSGSAPQVLEPAGILFVHPFYSSDHYAGLLEAVRPRWVIPTHWDNLWVPLDQPPKPMLQPPRWAFPPIGRVSLESFRGNIERLQPAARVFLPERLASYDLHLCNPPRKLLGPPGQPKQC